MRLALPAAQYDTPEKVVGFYQQLLGRVRESARRGARRSAAAAAARRADRRLGSDDRRLHAAAGRRHARRLAGRDRRRSRSARRAARRRTLADRSGHGRRAGRRAHQRSDGPEVLGRAGPDRPALPDGRRHAPWITVVGIVGNVRHNGVTAEIKPKFYRAHGQFHRSIGQSGAQHDARREDGGRSADARRRRSGAKCARSTPACRSPRSGSMQDVVDTSIATPRLTGWLLGVVRRRWRWRSRPSASTACCPTSSATGGRRSASGSRWARAPDACSV